MLILHAETLLSLFIIRILIVFFNVGSQFITLCGLELMKLRNPPVQPSDSHGSVFLASNRFVECLPLPSYKTMSA
jgi:hypothetical protein